MATSRPSGGRRTTTAARATTRSPPPAAGSSPLNKTSSIAWSARFSGYYGRRRKTDVMNTFLRGLLHLFRRSRHDADLREEIETHRALRQEALERDGLSSDNARWASR